MKKRQAFLLNFIAGAITFLIVYACIDAFLYFRWFIFFTDLTTSMVPGWHTTIYPFKDILYLTIILVILSAVVAFLFKYLYKMITYFWTK
jgi:hypothetical protein